MAEDKLADTEIAAEVGISRKTLAVWKGHQEFAAAVTEHREAWSDALRAKGIASKENRVAAYNDRWQLLKRVIEARAADPRMASIPGGDTGLLVATPLLVKVYEATDTETNEGEMTPARTSHLVYEYAVDTGLLKELREHEKQAAIELGEWQEKTDGRSSGGADVAVRVLVGVSLDEL